MWARMGDRRLPTLRARGGALFVVRFGGRSDRRGDLLSCALSLELSLCLSARFMSAATIV
eukprot:scaffold4315_cov25-Tisochrysis_lutea.AAC.1